MPYDRSLDNCILSKSYENDATRITVSVYSYNNGPKKLQITRENKDSQGNYRFTRLGRMNKQEIESILPYIKEMITELG